MIRHHRRHGGRLHLGRKPQTSVKRLSCGAVYFSKVRWDIPVGAIPHMGQLTEDSSRAEGKSTRVRCPTCVTRLRLYLLRPDNLANFS